MNKIKFARSYKMYNSTWYDVVYNSNRVYTFVEEDLPSTARKFIESATGIKDQYDSIFKRNETIYTA